MNDVFQGKAVNISRSEACLQNPEASRPGARVTEAETGESSPEQSNNSPHHKLIEKNNIAGNSGVVSLPKV